MKKQFTKFTKFLLATLIAFTSTATSLSTKIEDVDAASYYYGVTTGTNVTKFDIPALGEEAYYGTIYLDGHEAYCMEKSKLSYNNMQHIRVGTVTNQTTAKILTWAEDTNASRILVQAFVWASEEGKYTSRTIASIYAAITGENIFQGNATQIYQQIDASMTVINNTVPRTFYTYSAGSNYQKLATSYTGRVYTDPVSASHTATRTADESIKVKVKKTDIDTGKPITGVTFDFYKDGSKIGTATTNADGIASVTKTTTYSSSSTKNYVANWSQLTSEQQSQLTSQGYYPSKVAAQTAAENDAQNSANNKANQKHIYKAVEVSTNTAYWLDANNTIAEGTLTGSGTVNLSLTNARKLGTINLVKVDAETDSAQGNASLEGAVYGVYAGANILDPADGEVLYKEGELVTKLTTDKNGKATAKNLYMGNYTIKEITASEGYKLDTNPHTVKIDPSSSTERTITVSSNVTEDIITGNFHLTKIVTSGDVSEIAAPEENAEFIVMLKEHIEKYGDVLKAYEHINEMNYREYDKIITDKNGMASSKDLAYGTYVVKQVKGEVNTDIMTSDFEFTVKDIDQETKYYVINNKPFTSYLKVVKKDAETGKTVSVDNATFKIWSYDDNAYVDQKVGDTHYTTFTTNNKGYFQTPLQLESGKYRLEEVNAPVGYLLNDETVDFEVTNAIETEKDADGDYIVLAEFRDTSVKGQIEIYKEGEKLTSATMVDGKYEFVYDNYPLAGAEFQIIAREDILDPADGSVIYAKGTVIETVTTDIDGNAKSSILPLGAYTISELKAPAGYYNDKVNKDVDLEYKDATTPLVTVKYEKTNDRQKAEIKLRKKDADTNDGLEGAIYGLYNKYTIDDGNGYTLIEADTLIESATSDEDGYITFTADYPLGEYYVKEIKAPVGYATDTNTYTLDATAKAQTFKTFEVYEEVENEITKVEFIKTDLNTGKELEGATQKVYLKDDPASIHETWVSDEEPHIVKGLEVGKTYIWEETVAPYGFLIANSIEFTVQDTGEVQSAGVMEDKLVKGIIRVKKEGEVLVGTSKDEDGDYIFNYEVRPLENAIYEIYAKENIVYPTKDATVLYTKDELVETVTADKNGVATSSELPLGKYYIKEKTAPTGYTVSDEVKDVELTYVDGYTAIVYDNTEYSNERQKVEIELTKKDYDDDTLLSGAVFGLYTKEDIVAHDGSVLAEAGTLVETVTSDEKGEVIFKADLPLGMYEIKELQSPIGYASSDEIVEVDVTYRGQDIEIADFSYVFKNKITKVEVSKTDITTGEELPGAQLKVYEKDDKGAVFDTWVSGQDTDEDGNPIPHLIKGLETGKTYVLEETSSPYGFSIAEKVEFTVKDTGEIQKVHMEDKLVMGKLSFLKTGEIFTHTDMWQNEFGIVETPVWTHSSLLAHEITIYAAEDITLGNGITYYEKDEEIQIIESDWERAYSIELPVGKYYYVETKAALGYVPNEDKHYFEVEDNQKDEVQYVESDLENIRAKYVLDFTKVMEKFNSSEEFTDKSDSYYNNYEAYKDVVFGVFAREDIYNYMGEVAIPFDTMVGTTGVDKDGKITIGQDLPVGVYYLKELQTNTAYILDETEYDFSIGLSDKEENIVSVNNGESVMNTLKRFDVEISKMDEETDKLITESSATFTLSADYEGKALVATKETEKGYAMFKDLAYGTYYLRETSSPAGYKLSKKIVKIVINEDGVTIGDELVEEKDSVYSVEFENIKEEVVNTGDATNKPLWIGISGSSFAVALLTFISMLKNKRKKEQK